MTLLFDRKSFFYTVILSFAIGNVLCFTEASSPRKKHCLMSHFSNCFHNFYLFIFFHNNENVAHKHNGTFSFLTQSYNNKWTFSWNSNNLTHSVVGRYVIFRPKLFRFDFGVFASGVKYHHFNSETIIH